MTITQRQRRAAFAPEHGAEGFDAKPVALTRRKCVNLLPRRLLIGAQLLGRGRLRPVAGPSSGGGERFSGQRMELRVLADASDVSALRGQSLEHRGIGITSVAVENDRPRGVALLAQRPHLEQCLSVERALLLLLAVALQLLGVGILGRLGRRRRMEKTDGHHPRLALLQGPGRRELNKALATHQVGLEMGPQGVAAPTHSLDMGAAFTNQRVIHGDHQRLFGLQAGDHLVEHLLEEDSFIDPIPRVEPVGGAPVLLLTAARADQIGKRALLRTKQSAKHVLAQTLGAGGIGGCAVGGAKQGSEILSQ
jgi:hypothetical protein